jgi:exodeoxyribonuclease V gamma subunit
LRIVRALSGLHLHTSNRLENLLAELAEFVGKSLGSIFQPEIIVVQSAGMGRWLSLRLAEAHGICANVQFPFPQKFVSDVFRAKLARAGHEWISNRQTVSMNCGDR